MAFVPCSVDEKKRCRDDYTKTIKKVSVKKRFLCGRFMGVGMEKQSATNYKEIMFINCE